MTSRFTEIVVDGHNPGALADFWCAVLGYKIIDARPDLVEIAPAEYPDAWTEVTSREWKTRVREAAPAPTIVFLTVPETKTVKNRLHIDVSPIGSQAEEVERILALGATRADIGQGDVGWVVMRDPEDNEFCVLRSVEES
jgi:hypothetical protein